MKTHVNRTNVKTHSSPQVVDQIDQEPLVATLLSAAQQQRLVEREQVTEGEEPEAGASAAALTAALTAFQAALTAYLDSALLPFAAAGSSIVPFLFRFQGLPFGNNTLLWAFVTRVTNALMGPREACPPVLLSGAYC